MESARMLAEAIASKSRLTTIGHGGAVVEIIDAYDVDTIASFIAAFAAAIRKECADRAVAWAIENVNDVNDITNPPRFDEYDAAELRAAIEGRP